jgi:hypothetical protein
MRSIILLDYSMFIRQSKMEPMNDYLQKDVSTSFIKWWRWRINGILPSFWLLTILFWTHLHINYSRIIILSLEVHKREKKLSSMLSIDKLFYRRDSASIYSDCIITKTHTQQEWHITTLIYYVKFVIRFFRWTSVASYSIYCSLNCIISLYEKRKVFIIIRRLYIVHTVTIRLAHR